MYRWPKDDEKLNYEFYQRSYLEGMTTDMPSPNELALLIANNFEGTPKDLGLNVGIVKQHVSAGSLLDYGASWGYGVHQFKQAGYEAVGFEISRPRATYARDRLGAAMYDSMDELKALGSNVFDVIHASHVLEHLPTLDGVLQTFAQLLNPGGLLVVFVPNAGGALAKQQGVHWGPMIGEKHSLALDAAFFAHNLADYGFAPLFGSSPYDKPLLSSEDALRAEGLPGDELLVLATLRAA
jgi:2-polyprenyl-3-methyl-5-hydroxy-6-metoxy-1,4-benzoquinol methylase